MYTHFPICNRWGPTYDCPSITSVCGLSWTHSCSVLIYSGVTLLYYHRLTPVLTLYYYVCTAQGLTPVLTLTSDCGLTCHQKCISRTPNSCSLPTQLAKQLHPDSTPTKKLRREESKENTRDDLSLETTWAGRKRPLDSNSNSDDTRLKAFRIDLVRCETPIPSTIENTSSLSITSSMLTGSTDESDII